MRLTLNATNLTKQYAGLMAVDDFSIGLQHSQIHALIGPNGAGKSTAIGLLTGEVKADCGVIEFMDSDVSHLSVWQRAQAGIAHTYQITSVIKELSVLENIVIAMLANTHKNLIGMANPFKHSTLEIQADEILNQFNLTDSTKKPAGELSHGEQGRLEIAMCVATKPKVLLLDEPMSGMSLLDGEKMIALLNSIKASVAILLVEHDMEAVFKLADNISVMAFGKIIASGPPQTIRHDPQVIEAYLGNADA